MAARLDARTKRLTRELADIAKDTSSGITVRTVNDSLENLVGTFPGPSGTPYEGGVFEVEIKVPKTYPFGPLEMRLITKIWHPNISSQTGAICLSTLKEGWSPVLTIRTTLHSLQSLLSSPEPSDPQDAAVASQFLNDPLEFHRQARYFVQVYASPHASSSSSFPSPSSATPTQAPETAEALAESARIAWGDVVRFRELGFDGMEVVKVLSRLDYRGQKRARVADDDVLEALLGG